MADTNKPARRIPPATIALILAAIIALVAIFIVATRSDEPGAQPTNVAATATAPGQQAASIEQTIASLRQRVAQDPDNAEAWFLLGMALRDSEQVQQAELAFRRAMELQPNNVLHITYLAESQLLIGGDERRAEARRLLDRAAGIDAREPMVRFYRATLKDQDGDHRGAVDDLLALLRDAPAGAGWEPQVRAAVREVAQQHNIDIANRMPPPRPGSPATAAIPGPTREQMEAARGLAPAQQDQMVKGMVDRLANRLQQNPRDAEGWIRLMRSRMVLGERDAAAAALRSGLAAFGDDAAVQTQLRTAAQQLGVPGG